MNKKLLLLLTLFGCYHSFGQYCNSVGPTTDADSNVESVWLVGETGTINYTGCPGVIGLEEQLTETIYLNAGEQYTAVIQFGTCGGNYGGAGEAWIDFNGDGIFDVSESIGTWTGTPPVAASNFVFTVPVGVSNGQVRMRVNQQEGGTNPLDPCASYSWGSSVDFSIYLQNGIDCSGYVGNDVDDPRIVNSIPFNETYNSQICYTNENQVYSASDVYYLVLLNGMEAINVSLCGSLYDTFLSIMNTSGEVIAVNDDYEDCGTASEIDVITTDMDSLYVIVDGWGTQSGDYEINISALDLGIDNHKINPIKVYPNPSSGVINIQNHAFSSNVALLDLSGKLLKKFKSSNSLNLSNYDKGMYFLLFEVNGQQFTEKIILE